MKGEHELLKEIKDKIGYYSLTVKYTFINNSWFHNAKTFLDKWDKPVDVREIIFTPEFMLKLKVYISPLNEPKTINVTSWEWRIWLLQNLDNPVQYLANILSIKD